MGERSVLSGLQATDICLATSDLHDLHYCFSVLSRSLLGHGEPSAETQGSETPFQAQEDYFQSVLDLTGKDKKYKVNMKEKKQQTTL